MTGTIIKIISNDFTVLSNNKLYVCKARGKFRNINVTPLVGDIVKFDEKNNPIPTIIEATRIQAKTIMVIRLFFLKSILDVADLKSFPMTFFNSSFVVTASMSRVF